MISNDLKYSEKQRMTKTAGRQKARKGRREGGRKRKGNKTLTMKIDVIRSHRDSHFRGAGNPASSLLFTPTLQTILASSDMLLFADHNTLGKAHLRTGLLLTAI